MVPGSFVLAILCITLVLSPALGETEALKQMLGYKVCADYVLAASVYVLAASNTNTWDVMQLQMQHLPLALAPNVTSVTLASVSRSATALVRTTSV